MLLLLAYADARLGEYRQAEAVLSDAKVRGLSRKQKSVEHAVAGLIAYADGDAVRLNACLRYTQESLDEAAKKRKDSGNESFLRQLLPELTAMLQALRGETERALATLGQAVSQ